MSLDMPEPLHTTRLSMSGFDPTAMEGAVQGAEFQHTQLAGGYFQGRILRAESDVITLDWGRYNLPVLGQGSLSADFLTLGIVVEPIATAIVNGREVSRTSVLLFPEGHELVTSLPPRPQWIAIRLSRERLARLGFETPAREMLSVALSEDAANSLVSQLIPALRVLDEGYDVAAACGRQAGLNTIADIDDLAIHALQTLLDGSRQASSGCHGFRSYRLARRVAEFIDANFSHPLKISDVCVAADTTYRELDRAFLKAHGISPKRYLTLKRLSKLRELLLSDEGVSQSLSTSFMSCGLAHFGRASGSYKALFGEPPSASVKRFRGRRSRPWIS